MGLDDGRLINCPVPRVGELWQERGSRAYVFLIVSVDEEEEVETIYSIEEAGVIEDSVVIRRYLTLLGPTENLLISPLPYNPDSWHENMKRVK